MRDQAISAGGWQLPHTLEVYPQKPIKKACEQRPVAIKSRLDNE